MEQFIQKIIEFIVERGALGVFLASILEEVIVPIPSTIIQTGAGFLFLEGQPVNLHSIWILISRVSLPTAAGVTIGSLLIYGLVYWGGAAFIERFGKYFFLSPAKLERAKEYVLSHKSLLWAFCILRFLPLFPNSLITAGAGFIRLPLRHYIWTTFLGVFVRATYLGIAGWLTGEAFHTVSPNGSVFGMFLSFAGGLLLISLVTGFVIGYVRKRKNRRV